MTPSIGTGLTGLLHQAFSAELQLPQIRVQEQRVELDLATRFQQLDQSPVVEDLLGDLSTAGEFGPVPGVGRRGHDLGVDGRGGHAGQQDG
jgi:hypothetical protein